MIWHIVRFDLSSLPAEVREEIEASLRGLADLEVVAWLEVARDVDDPGITGLLTLFASYEDLEAYRVHPHHVPVVERIRDLGVPVTRLDLDAEVPPADLAR